MVIGCLGVERRAERFFSYLAILTPTSLWENYTARHIEEFQVLKVL